MAKLSRTEMGQAILDLVAGQENEAAFQAQADALATGIGGGAYLAGESVDYALQFLEALHDGMADHVVKHWGSYDEQPIQ